MNNITMSLNDFITSNEVVSQMKPELAKILIAEVGGFTEFSQIIELQQSSGYFLDMKPFNNTDDLIDLYSENKALFLGFLTTKAAADRNQTAIEWVDYERFIFESGSADAIAFALYNPKMALKSSNEKSLAIAKGAMTFTCTIAIKSLAQAYTDKLANISPKPMRDIESCLKSIDFDDEKAQGRDERAPTISRALATEVIRRLGGQQRFLSQYKVLGREGLTPNVAGFSTDIDCIQFYENNDYLITRFLLMLANDHAQSSKLQVVKRIILKNELDIDDVAKGLYGNGEYLDDQTEQRKKVIWNIVDRVVRYTSHQFEYHLEGRS